MKSIDKHRTMVTVVNRLRQLLPHSVDCGHMSSNKQAIIIRLELGEAFWEIDKYGIHDLLKNALYNAYADVGGDMESALFEYLEGALEQLRADATADAIAFLRNPDTKKTDES